MATDDLPCSCGDAEIGPCPAHTACALCGEPAWAYADDTTLPICLWQVCFARLYQK